MLDAVRPFVEAIAEIAAEVSVRCFCWVCCVVSRLQRLEKRGSPSHPIRAPRYPIISSRSSSFFRCESQNGRAMIEPEREQQLVVALSMSTKLLAFVRKIDWSPRRRLLTSLINHRLVQLKFDRALIADPDAFARFRLSRLEQFHDRGANSFHSWPISRRIRSVHWSNRAL